MHYSFYRSILNPSSKPYHLAGFYSDRIKEQYFGNKDLLLRILLLNDGEQKALFISLDTLYFSKDFTLPLINTIKNKFMLSEDQVIFNASHTHSAPNISMPLWYPINEQYRQSVHDEILKGIAHCFGNSKKGELSFCTVTPGKSIFINRRKKARTPKSFFLKRDTLRLPNDKKEVDNNIRMFVIKNPTDDEQIVLFNFSCHPVFNRTDEYSSDFTGEISSMLERNGFNMAMFLQGFSGDIRLNYTSGSGVGDFLQKLNIKKKLYVLNFWNIKLLVKVLLYKSIFPPYSKEYFDEITSYISDHIINGAKNCMPLNSDKFNVTGYQTSLQSETGQTLKSFRVNLMRIKNKLIISVPAEVNCAYYLDLRRNFPGIDIIPAGCGYEMIGYLPFHTEINEGGYEVDSYSKYGWDSRIDAKSIESFYRELREKITLFLN